MPFYIINSRQIFVGNAYKQKTQCRPKLIPPMALKLASVFIQTDESGNSQESKRISSSCITTLTTRTRVGIIGGVSVFSTLVFLEKLVWLSSRNGETCIPFIVSSDPFTSSFSSPNNALNRLNQERVIGNLRCQRAFLEQSGARCIVLPCHVLQARYHEVFEGCSVPFLSAGDCVARELKEANLKPIEAGRSRVRIGVLFADGISITDFYREKLHNQGFEVVVADKATMEHTIIPAIEALKRKDMEGARNLLRIAIHVLLMKSVDKVIIASDKFQCLLPCDDPLLKKCIDPMDALARSTVKWAQSTSNVH